ncbi:uncharacterized protein LOC134280185, partial [Saccostrea cucullata]|uniref:uncharacterized protein LOC134280185 n=1 Tax=Saccostrea cuccullata TaxID=36930 RepID=UPI002ED5C1AC
MDSFITVKTTLQHMSESAFMGLCDKLGTSQLVAMRRDVVDIRDMVENQRRTRDEVSVMVSGSYREGFRLEGSDVDFMYWPNDHRVIWELSQSQYYNTHRQSLILCDCSDSPPGFTLLYLLSPSKNRSVQRACVRVNNRLYVSSSEYRKIICSAFLPDSIPHGPCVSGVLSGGAEYDFAHCFVSDFWPPSASSWIDRCHSWPQSHIVDDIVKNGCHFVAIGHKLGRLEDQEWRISFSFAEHRLVCAMNHCQFLTYGLLKLFLREIIHYRLSDDHDKLLCSYHMKTAVFWAIQQNTLQHWCPQNLLGFFWVCFKQILKWVYEGVCPNFFIPQNNMFLSKVNGETQHHLFIRLHGLYEKGLTFLLHSSSIRSCIINVLLNPHLSICTDEHTLISETKFDTELFQEIYKFDTLSSSNLETYMKYLHTIELLIDSPLLTQYQVLMLQTLTATVLQNIPYILHIETYTHKNKLKYRVDKMSCHMLKLAAKFGCITDMIYIAMYYYKTRRYMEALSIIEMIKVKFAQPYVMFMFVDTEMYTRAVGGQSRSAKMRQAVAWDITLNNGIHYISELISEQMSSLQNYRPSLYVPQFIMLYMLEIFCYRYIHTMRAQTALDDLQTLVHYDQGQLINSDYRDISWQILGICQQVTGNLQAALYSYQQSLGQESHNGIQTATEIRIQEYLRVLPHK